jgi:TonB family protein
LLRGSRFSHFLFILVVSICHFLIIIWMLVFLDAAGGELNPGVLNISFAHSPHDLVGKKKLPTKARAGTSSSSDAIPIQEGVTSESQGGDSESASTPLGRSNRQILHGPKPHYPLISKRLKEQGLVVIKICVNPRGLVDEVDIHLSSGSQALDRSALKTLSEWRFSPIGSQSLHSSLQCFQTPVQFTLES